MLKAVLKKDSLFCWAFDVLDYCNEIQQHTGVWLTAILPGIQMIAVPRSVV